MPLDPAVEILAWAERRGVALWAETDENGDRRLAASVIVPAGAFRTACRRYEREIVEYLDGVDGCDAVDESA